ncbi:MAG: phospholipid/cholesterol/gamma-HCH transport system substrate-binding protein [Solirubrobacterales bacterium]|nr:phospholipid/cholesterol/gamma-HCH transport system substrate-binding protein [Solirubrobacterales bacterium]
MHTVSAPRPRRLGRLRRALRPRGPQPRLGRTLIALQALAALVFAGYLLASEGVRSPFADTFTLRAEFADAAGLRTDNHSPVTVAGVPAGTVADVSFENGVAVATLDLEPSAASALGDRTTARIVSRSALQDLTVDLDPAGGRQLSDGATIAPSRTSSTVGADRVVGILDADTRAQVQVLLPELAAALHGRAPQLRGGLAELGRTLDSGARVTAALADRRRELVRFVDELDSVSARLAARRAQLGDAVDAAERTLAVTAGRDRELGDSFSRLPATLSELDGALSSVTALSKPLAPALTELEPVAEHLPAALAGLRGLVPAANGLVDDLDGLTRDGAAPLAHLRELLQRLGPASSAIDGSVSDLEPIVRAIDRNKEGIGVLGDRFSGVFSTNDANGPILRGLGFFEPFTPEDLGFAAGAQGPALARARADSVAALTRVCLHENPVACLARYLVPGLPGFVGSADAGGGG